jgi:hypothetical protein
LATAMSATSPSGIVFPGTAMGVWRREHAAFLHERALGFSAEICAGMLSYATCYRR